MYEYDEDRLIPLDGFPFDPPPAPDFVTGPDDTMTLWDLDAEFEHMFRPPPPDDRPRGHREHRHHRHHREHRDRRDQGGQGGLGSHGGHGDQGSHREHRVAPARVDRRRRPSLLRPRWASVVGAVIAVATAIVAGAVSVLGAMVSYAPMRDLASPTAHGLANSWPLLVFGPWFVGCLSILHAAAHRRQVRAPWVAVIAFSLVAVTLCVAHAPKTAAAIATAGLPPVSALAGFHLLFRQITLLHPRHAKLPRQRKH